MRAAACERLKLHAACLDTALTTLSNALHDGVKALSRVFPNLLQMS